MMTLPSLSSRPQRLGLALLAAVVGAALAGVAMFAANTVAQVEGERGIAAIASSNDIEVGGIEVDETGKSGEDARKNGWREGQRKAWAKIGGPQLSDGQLDGLVTAIIIEHEDIGARRYIAKLGVIFDRSRARSFLGGEGQRARSAPMLVLPVTITGGTQLIYEQRNPWQRAWAEYQAGGSRLDYVRPSGAGGDSLLLTYGQTERRSRSWWRNVLDEFGAGDVLVPIVRLDYEYPGGPVRGTFTGRYGPDNTYLGSFTMRSANPAGVPAMMTRAVSRFDAMFANALGAGKLTPDASLNVGLQGMDPTLQRLIELGRTAEAQEQSERAARAAADERSRPDTEQSADPAAEPTATPTAATVTAYVVQFASPDAASIDATLSAVRSAPGVRGAATSSLAIGGTSVMRVSYGGSIGELAAALRGRGFTVNQGSSALAISR